MSWVLVVPPASPLDAQDASAEVLITAEGLASACAPRTDGATQGVLAGIVLDDLSDVPLPGVRIRADWGDPDLRPGELRVGGGAASSDRTESIDQGLWYLCGVGAGEVRLEASIGDSIYAVRTLELDAGTVRRVDFRLAFSRPGERTGLFGWVRDRATGDAIPDAELSLVGIPGTAISGPSGFFAIDSIRPGTHLLEVRHLSYAPLTVPVLLEPGQAGEVTVGLSAQAFELEGLEVTVRSSRRLRGLQELERRKELGFGTFLDADGLERNGVYYLGEALRVLRGAGARTFGWGVTATYAIRRRGGYCTPAVFIDGRRDRTDSALTWFTASQITAVEMHRGPSVPAEFTTADGAHECGVISAWTR